MRWTLSSIAAVIFICAAILLILLTPHKQLGIFLNTIGVLFLVVYSRKYGTRVNAPFDHEKLRLF
jgi:hypothetical protein